MIANPSSVSREQRDHSIKTASAGPRTTSCEDIQRETEFLTCLINTGHKSYLSHPLVEAFIVLKWQRVRIFFWISFICYVSLSFFSLKL